MNHFLVDCVIVILLGPWAYFKSKAWLASFKQFKEEQRYYQHRKQYLLQRQQYWEFLLSDLYKKQVPFDHLSDEDIHKMGKCAWVLIQNTKNYLDQLKEYYGY